MATLGMGGFELGLAVPPSAVFDNIAMAGDEYVCCYRCGFGGCDVRVSGCGCTLHVVRRKSTECVGCAD